MSTPRILLGRFGRAHGIRGEVSVTTYTAEPESIAAYGPLSDESGRHTFELEVVRVTPRGGAICRVEGIADRTAAEKLNGIDLYVDRAKLPEPEAGTFYHEDLIGLAAISPDGQRIGEVVGIQNFGAGDLIEIRLEGGRNTELLPFQDPFVGEVDIAGRRIVVVMPAEEEDEPDDAATGDEPQR